DVEKKKRKVTLHKSQVTQHLRRSRTKPWRKKDRCRKHAAKAPAQQIQEKEQADSTPPPNTWGAQI
ncbi:hypothetical protein, partial [Mycobacterium tuberculosis]